MVMAANSARKIPERGGARHNAGRKSVAERESDVYADYNAARAKREMHNAKIAEYEERRIAGELIERSKADAREQQGIMNAKSKFMSMPSKLAPMMIGLESIAEAEEILRTAIYEALLELSRGR